MIIILLSPPRAFIDMDVDGDGEITMEEWVNGMTKEIERALHEKLNDDMVLEGFAPLVNVSRVFEQIDSDGSGDLSVNELRSAFKCLGISGTDADAFFKFLDKNGDEVVSLDEWKKGLTSEMKTEISKHLDDRGLLADFKEDWSESRGRTDEEGVTNGKSKDEESGEKDSLDVGED